MAGSLVSLSGIRQEYSGRKVLDLDHLELTAGSITGISGPNGCGKSTLMRILARLEAPVSGTMLLKGQSLDMTEAAGHEAITLLLQEPFLLKRSVFANVAFGLKMRKAYNIEKRVHESLRTVGLDPMAFAARKWYELSGGEAQRVALAARLAIRPKLLLLDEPTASLDERSAATIRAASLAARNDSGTTLVIVSHDMNWLKNVCDTIIRMERGCIVGTDILQGAQA
jgi:tungstate transport system ATP-binding protein